MSDPTNPEGQKNHHEEFEEYLKTLPPVYARKLLFSEKCGLAYALKKGERADVVAKAFSLSRATISWLAHCLQPGKKHYADVWQEWQRLGEDAFRERYFTPELFHRLKRVRLELAKLDENKTDRATRRVGPDPRANKYAFETFGPIEVDDVDWGIFYEDGWYCRAIKPREGYISFIGLHSIHGREDPEPFASSSLAYDGLHDFHGYPSPRPKPGRRAK